MPCKGHKGLKKTVQRVVSSAFESPESVPDSPETPRSLFTPVRHLSDNDNDVYDAYESHQKAEAVTEAALKKAVTEVVSKVLGTNFTKIDAKYDDMKNCFLQLQDNFFKKTRTR
jgi:hypothetical protein